MPTTMKKDLMSIYGEYYQNSSKCYVFESLNFVFSTQNEKIIIEKIPVEQEEERPVIKPITFKPSSFKKPSTLVNRPISTVSKKNPNVSHTDLVTSYRKKTCQQLSDSKVLNATMKGLTMDRMKCNTVDFLNFDSDSDPNLNKDTAQGMEILMKK